MEANKWYIPSLENDVFSFFGVDHLADFKVVRSRYMEYVKKYHPEKTTPNEPMELIHHKRELLKALTFFMNRFGHNKELLNSYYQEGYKKAEEKRKSLELEEFMQCEKREEEKQQLRNGWWHSLDSHHGDYSEDQQPAESHHSRVRFVRRFNPFRRPSQPNFSINLENELSKADEIKESLRRKEQQLKLMETRQEQMRLEHAAAQRELIDLKSKYEAAKLDMEHSGMHPSKNPVGAYSPFRSENGPRNWEEAVETVNATIWNQRKNVFVCLICSKDDAFEHHDQRKVCEHIARVH